MGVFLRLMGSGSSQPKLKKYREMKDYTSEQMRGWLMKNMTLDEIIELCGLLILEELNDETTPITITQKEFEQHFRIRKPHQIK